MITRFASRTLWRLLAVLMAFVLIAAACSDDDSAEPAEAPAEEPAEEPAEAPAEEPAEEPAEAPAEEPAEAPAEEPAAAPAEEPAEEPAEAPAEEPAEAPAESLFSQAAHDLLPDRIKEEGNIRFVGGPNPPFRIPSADGEGVEGADVDLAGALGEILGVDVTLELSDSGDAARQGILADRYDVYMGPSRLNAARAESFDGISYSRAGTSVILLVESTINTDEDLCGQLVAATEGGRDFRKLGALSEVCVAAGNEAIEILELGDPSTLVLAVLSGRADAAVSTTTVGADAPRTNPELRSFRGMGEILGAALDAGDLHLPDLSSALYEAFLILFDAGEYQRIYEVWNLQDATIPAPLLNHISE